MSSPPESVKEKTTTPGSISRLLRRASGTLKTGFAVVGFAAAAGLCSEYLSLRVPEEDDTKKRVLVLPFHKLQLVERKSPNFAGSLSQLDDDNNENVVEQMETSELVEALHQAASDPSIAAVYGIFGHGSNSTMGWATAEEIRNALQVIKESHRRHASPNVSHDTQNKHSARVPSKPLYAYADTLTSVQDPSNKDYYLMSVFTHVHLQQSGELNLFGMLSTQYFVRNLLEKYGLQLHVFKHGVYKNAPNMFTHTSLNRFHRENLTNLQNAIHNDVCDEITRARSKTILTPWLSNKRGQNSSLALWKRIHESGTFPATAAWKGGLVDHMPRRDPLTDLVKSNDTMEDDGLQKKEVTSHWESQETDFERFKAAETVSLKDYIKQISKKEKSDKRRSQWWERAAKYPFFQQALGLFGVIQNDSGEADPRKETIALLQVNGTVSNAMANKLVSSIRKIHKDEQTKCVVVRVDSPGGLIVPCETVRQELKALHCPVVFSFGNVAASGGYYIASDADRIFGSKKTITGSIGVFGIRMDLTGLAKKYNINVDNIVEGELAGSYAPFHPMSTKMKQNFGEQVDRSYAQFKQVVSQGRGLTEDDVETLGQGRVWTGEQAKTNGLVDELGGLQRAIDYARRNFTKTGDAEVVVWPKRRSLFERLMEAKEKGNLAQFMVIVAAELISGSEVWGENAFATNPPETAASIREIAGVLAQTSSVAPSSLSGVFLTVDENAAIACLLEKVRDQRKPAGGP